MGESESAAGARMSAQAVRWRRPTRTERLVLGPFWFAGWLILQALFLAADLAERAYAEMGRPNWGDVIGGVIFIPVAFGLVFSMMVGWGAFAHWLALL